MQIEFQFVTNPVDALEVPGKTFDVSQMVIAQPTRFDARECCVLKYLLTNLRLIEASRCFFTTSVRN